MAIFVADYLNNILCFVFSYVNQGAIFHPAHFACFGLVHIGFKMHNYRQKTHLFQELKLFLLFDLIYFLAFIIINIKHALLFLFKNWSFKIHVSFRP